MSCAKECLKVNSSVCVTENQACTKSKAKDDDHEVQLALPSSSHNAVSEESSVVAEKHSTVDRSAFNLQRKPIKYIDTLPNPKAETSKNSLSKNTFGKRKLSSSSEPLHKDHQPSPKKITGKQKSSSSSEPKHKDHQPSPKKVHFSPTDDNHTNLSNKDTRPKLRDQPVLSAMDKQKVTQDKLVLSSSLTPTGVFTSQQANVLNYRTGLIPALVKNTSQMTIQTNDTDKFSKIEAFCSTSLSTALKSVDDSHEKTPSSFSVSSVPSNTANNHPSSGSRQVEFGNVSAYNSNDNRTDKWGGQRKRISHYANLSDAQKVRKRHHDDNTGSKKAKLN